MQTFQLMNDLWMGRGYQLQLSSGKRWGGAMEWRAAFKLLPCGGNYTASGDKKKSTGFGFYRSCPVSGKGNDLYIFYRTFKSFLSCTFIQQDLQLSTLWRCVGDTPWVALPWHLYTSWDNECIFAFCGSFFPLRDLENMETQLCFLRVKH